MARAIQAAHRNPMATFRVVAFLAMFSHIPRLSIAQDMETLKFIKDAKDGIANGGLNLGRMVMKKPATCDPCA